MAELLYKAAAPQGEQPGEGDGATTSNGAGAAPSSDDVIDAEFKEAQ